MRKKYNLLTFNHCILVGIFKRKAPVKKSHVFTFSHSGQVCKTNVSMEKLGEAVIYCFVVSVSPFHDIIYDAVVQQFKIV